MRSAQIAFKNKKVLIIGGGEQAVKKGNQFIEDGAIVSYLAPLIDKRIKAYKMKEYAPSDLSTDIFLVYACTNDRNLNHQIMLDANHRGILCASVHQDDMASYHPLQVVDFPYLHVALSTHGAYPAYINTILLEIKDSYKRVHHVTLEKLQFIRSYVLKLTLTHDEKVKLLRSIANCSYGQIRFYEQAIKTQKAMVAIFHGNTNDQFIPVIEKFLKMMDVQRYALYFAYLNNETNQSRGSLKTIDCHLRQLQIKQVKFQPMLLTANHCANKIHQLLYDRDILPLLIDQQHVNQLINAYTDCEQGVLVIHDAKQTTFYEMLKSFCPAHLHMMMLNEKIPRLDSEKVVTLYGMFILSGKHLQKDVMSKQGICGKLEAMGYRVQTNQLCLLQLPQFQEIFKERLQSIFT